MATQPSSTIRPTARSGVFCGERKPRSTRYRTSARTGRKKEVQKKIFNGDRCAKESPIYIAGPRYHSARRPKLRSCMVEVLQLYYRVVGFQSPKRRHKTGERSWKSLSIN